VLGVDLHPATMFREELHDTLLPVAEALYEGENCTAVAGRGKVPAAMLAKNGGVQA